MKKVIVKVIFEGEVEVMVPTKLSAKDAKSLAEKKALCQVVASVDNVDAPEEDAFDEFREESDLKNPGTVWDESLVNSVGGTWKLG